MCSAHDWNAKSHERWRQLCFTSSLQVRPSRETPAKHSVLPDYHFWFTLSMPTLLIPTLPTDVEEWLQRENPSHKPCKLEIVIPTYLYTFAYRISSTPTSQFPYHWEVDSPNNYHTLSEWSVRFWYYWEALEEAKDGRCNMELVAGFGELDKTRFRVALLE